MNAKAPTKLSRVARATVLSAALCSAQGCSEHSPKDSWLDDYKGTALRCELNGDEEIRFMYLKDVSNGVAKVRMEVKENDTILLQDVALPLSAIQHCIKAK